MVHDLLPAGREHATLSNPAGVIELHSAEPATKPEIDSAVQKAGGMSWLRWKLKALAKVIEVKAIGYVWLTSQTGTIHKALA